MDLLKDFRIEVKGYMDILSRRIEAIEDKLYGRPVDYRQPDYKSEAGDIEPKLSPSSDFVAAPVEDNLTEANGYVPTRPSNKDEEVLKRLQKLDECETDPGGFVPPGEMAFPPNHTTSAGNLLQWPPIKELMQPHLEKEKVKRVDTFPFNIEKSRGVLRVYGRGEGREKESHQSNTYEVADYREDESEPVSSPSPLSDNWGQLGGISPGPVTMEAKGSSADTYSKPDYSESTVMKLLTSCSENVFNIHPLMSKDSLLSIGRIFLNKLPRGPPPKSTNKEQTVAGFLGTDEAHTGGKRKWSPTMNESQIPQPNPSRRPGRPHRHIRNAFILMAMAIGKLSLHRTRIPDPLPEVDHHHTNSSPPVRNGVPVSPIVPSPHSSLPSPKDDMRPGFPMSRRSSLQGATAANRPMVPMRKNYDVIPGLEYFALATDILGNEKTGETMQHVWTWLLGGLYWGQMGRVHDSIDYIQTASRKLHSIMEPKMERLRGYKQWLMGLEKPKEGSGKQYILTLEDNQYLIAFWTCLQLESDIIAELRYLPSILLSYDEALPYPSTELMVRDKIDPDIAQSYGSQLFLRKQLNTLHGTLYNPRQPDKRGFESCCEPLANWLPPSEKLKFTPLDGPAKDLLPARLRAKFWGAQVITYRRFVRYIIDYNRAKEGIPFPQEPEYDGITFNNATITRAEKALTALKESTRAFWMLGAGDGRRIVVTNIFGTAHAQWGNLLTLAVAYRDPTLSKFLDEDEMKLLFCKTIRFIELNAAASSALAIDARLLRGLAHELLHMTDTELQNYRWPDGKVFRISWPPNPEQPQAQLEPIPAAAPASILPAPPPHTMTVEAYPTAITTTGNFPS